MSDARPSNTAAMSPDALPSTKEAAVSPARTLVLSEFQLFYTPPNIPLKGTADNLMVINWVLDTSQSVARGLFILTLGDWLFDFNSGLSGFSWKIGDAARLARYPYWFTAAMWLVSSAPLVGFVRALLAVRRCASHILGFTSRLMINLGTYLGPIFSVHIRLWHA